MRWLVLFVMTCLPLPAFASEGSIFPDNDLWREDCLACESDNGMTEDVFNRIADAGIKVYAEEAAQFKEYIKINKLWSNATVNANVRRVNNKYIEINMYGGLARRPEVNPSGFAVVLCHELGGHAYGGYPYVQPQNKLSAEGQADYMATKECYERVYNEVPELQKVEDSYEKFIEDNCNDLVCKNSLYGSKGLAILLSTLSNDSKAPDYNTPDPYVTPITMLSYPKTIQCRLDSYAAGTLKLPQPACWFKN